MKFVKQELKCTKKVCVDTNILVSALITKGGNAHKILELAEKNQITCVYNDHLLVEYYQVLIRKKFADTISKADIEKTIEIIKKGIICYPEISTIPFTDEYDRKFYDTAVNSNSILITGNIKHYPNEDFILPPTEFLLYFNEIIS